ncbi:MAG: ABC transporter permease [Lachnospiraceae bacterium]
MSIFFTEIRKTRRTGVIPIMLIVSFVGILYTYTFLELQKETLLNFDLTITEILLTQASSFVVILNLFAIILVTSIIYNLEHRGNAIKKMYMLPIKIRAIYINKLIICIILLFVCIIIEYFSLLIIGRLLFPLEIITFHEFIVFALYVFTSSLPTLTFMLMISSKSENLWIVIGVGVLGFLSGMTMSMGNGIFFLVNPFVLILKPSISGVIQPQTTNIIISLVESIIFTIGGVYLAEKIFYE